MKTNKKILVTVSALALRAITPSAPAMAQLVVSCPQPLRFGRVVTCGNGSLHVTPNDATSTFGCVVIENNAMAGQCIVKTGGLPIPSNVTAKLTINNIQISNAGNKVLINDFSLLYTGTLTPKETLTLTPAEVSNTVTINIGGTINYNGNHPLGSYTGSITMTVN